MSSCGLTMVIDTGLPTGVFTDVISSHGEYVDLVKFGWGTALVTRDLDRKIAVLREADIGFYFGGTLFERYLFDDRLGDFLALVERTGATHIEVSNGTIPLDQHAKAEQVRRMARYRPVLAEVGYKDPERSARLTPADWVDAITEDLEAGASLVTTETRESGCSGIARPDGHLRDEVLHAVLAAVDPARLLFEAPTKDLQVELIRALGPGVNLGNIATTDVLGVATLRLGLRADTLLMLSSRVASVA
jgi:phosphosulfolactate synthase